MRVSISLSQIEYALSVQRHKSFSLAARANHVSQPALSEMIRKLEQSLGVILFDRKRQPLSVTEVGIEILTQAQKALDETKRIAEIANSWKGLTKGVLRVGLIPTLAPSLIPYFLKSLRKKYPEIQVEIFEAPTDDLLSALQKNDIDVAILSTPQNAPGHFIEKPLFYESFCVYAGNGSELLKKKILKLAEIEKEKLILMDESHCARDQVLSICHAKRKFNATTVRGGLQTLISVIDNEGGFTLIPELLAELVNKSHLREFEGGRHLRKVSMLINMAHLKRKLIEILMIEILNNLPNHISRKRESGSHVVPPDSRRFNL